MEGKTVDSADCIHFDEYVFDNDRSERSSWNFGNSDMLPQSGVLFFTQAILSFIVIKTTQLKMVFDAPSADEKTVWFFVSFETVGFNLSNPHVLKNECSQTIVFSCPWLIQACQEKLDYFSLRSRHQHPSIILLEKRMIPTKIINHSSNIWPESWILKLYLALTLNWSKSSRNVCSCSMIHLNNFIKKRRL